MCKTLAMNIDALIHARWIIPIEPAGTVLEHHALAVHQGRIIDIIDSSEADERYSATSVIHLDGHALARVGLPQDWR